MREVRPGLADENFLKRDSFQGCVSRKVFRPELYIIFHFGTLHHLKSWPSGIFCACHLLTFKYILCCRGFFFGVKNTYMIPVLNTDRCFISGACWRVGTSTKEVLSSLHASSVFLDRWVLIQLQIKTSFKKSGFTKLRLVVHQGLNCCFAINRLLMIAWKNSGVVTSGPFLNGITPSTSVWL